MLLQRNVQSKRMERKKRSKCKTMTDQPEPVTEQQIIDMTQKLMKEMPYEKVYFTLKKMKQKPIFPSLVRKARACLALHQLGLPITTYTLEKVLGFKKRSGALGSLHNLGDRNILTLVRDRRPSESKIRGFPFLRWVLNPLFLRAYEGNNKENST